jgi:GNAT superfamily N-acetyltransferase
MSPFSVAIRWANDGDVPRLVEFNARLAAETEGMTLDPATLERGIRRLLADDRKGRYLVAEHQGEIVGQLMHTYEWSDWRDGDIWWIQSVYVAEPYRRFGIYRRLHDHLREQARQNGQVVGIRLYVENDNHRAAEVYRQLGMVDAPYRVMQEIFVGERR